MGSSQKIMKNTMVIWAESYYPIQGYFWGGALGTLVYVLFWGGVGRCISKTSKKWAFVEIFEKLLPKPAKKSLFITFLLTNFPKISKKVLKNFSRRLRRRKRVEISPFFHPWSVDGTPPRGVTSPKNKPDPNPPWQKNGKWTGGRKIVGDTLVKG